MLRAWSALHTQSLLFLHRGDFSFASKTATLIQKARTKGEPI